MLKMMLFAAVAMGLSAATCAAQAAASGKSIVWHDAAGLTVEGRGWNDTESFYHRLPARAKAIVIPPVWGLATNSAGIVVRFVSDATAIQARWTLNNAELAMNHMAATGVSGIDLYVRLKGKWQWLAVGRPTGQQNEVALISNMPEGLREYALYLPLYNGVSRVELGVPDDAKLDLAPPRARDFKPVVFYGSSITQGGCASRPGMAYPAIIGRALDIPTINLGFSGNGRCEHEVADLLAELDPSAYVIDALPNMDADTVDDRINYLLKAIRAKHPESPVILVEHAIFPSAFNRAKGPEASATWNRALAKVYRDNAPEWNGRLRYVKCDKLMGDDGEATVDGIHPTDVGFLRMAAVLTPAVKKALGM
ncbi:MAG TPA: SGNH/GDSL hydrolase family protein [Armatimonadota bacterium]|jgi:lysophospholipase L1-like esterase